MSAIIEHANQIDPRLCKDLDLIFKHEEILNSKTLRDYMIYGDRTIKSKFVIEEPFEEDLCARVLAVMLTFKIKNQKR